MYKKKLIVDEIKEISNKCGNVVVFTNILENRECLWIVEVWKQCEKWLKKKTFDELYEILAVCEKYGIYTVI